jgi:hypothetical protein
MVIQFSLDGPDNIIVHILVSGLITLDVSVMKQL